MRVLYIVIFVVSFGFASVDDVDYYIDNSSSLTIIYPKEYKEAVENKKSFILDTIEYYANSYNYRFVRPLYIILHSDNSQVANANATTYPFNQTNFYGGGASGAVKSNIDSYNPTFKISDKLFSKNSFVRVFGKPNSHKDRRLAVVLVQDRVKKALKTVKKLVKKIEIV